VLDFWKLTKGFSQGDIVQRFAPGAGGYSMSPFVGRVTAVHRGLGQVDVGWPYGNERMSPDEIVRVDPKISVWLSPEFDQSYMSYDIQKARSRWASVNELWRGSTLPAGFYQEVARAWGQGFNEVGAYDAIWHRYAASGVSDDNLRLEIEKFYRVADGLTDLRIQQHVRKTATYWVAQNRQYRVTSDELTSRRPVCPKCGTRMRRTTYKMDKGARHRLFACPKDLFLIKTDNILGPGGEPVEW
jgi:ribosomal protein S27AE